MRPLDHRELRAARLVHITDEQPGITRRPQGDGFVYIHPDGTPVRDPAELERIRRLGIPPAYRDVWIAPASNAHLQATGRDARGRKQYRYHPDWIRLRDRGKYQLLREFGEALPHIRDRIACDLEGRGLPRDRVIAAILRLLDIGHIRVGNSQYAAENNSYGATTLQTDHVIVSSRALTLEFVGKGGKRFCRKLHDPNLARTVRRCHELGGQQLFLYVDEDGERHAIGSHDVNDYLHVVAGEGFSAKQFRTWSAGTIAFETIHRHVAAGGDAGALSLKDIVDPVAEALGNTPAISRSSYIHPGLIDAVKQKSIAPAQFQKLPRPTRYLTAPERGFLGFLRDGGWGG